MGWREEREERLWVGRTVGMVVGAGGGSSWSWLSCWAFPAA